MTLNEQDKNPLDNESRLRAIIETAIDGIITIDQKGIIETINPAAAKIFEYAADEVIGQNIKILMPEPDKSKHDEYIENYQRTGEKKIIGIGREVMGKKKRAV
ncbi:MAG: PAS domain S-box protein [Sporocytophaga sp.]|nr:PAS domain S-box protein [Sporocytophaga sp.]